MVAAVGFPRNETEQSKDKFAFWRARNFLFKIVQVFPVRSSALHIANDIFSLFTRHMFFVATVALLPSLTSDCIRGEMYNVLASVRNSVAKQGVRPARSSFQLCILVTVLARQCTDARRDSSILSFYC